MVAYRLSEFYDVLLLEAGGEMNDFQLIPAMSLLMLNYPEIDWRHKTVPQKHSCWGSPKNVIFLLKSVFCKIHVHCCLNS